MKPSVVGIASPSELELSRKKALADVYSLILSLPGNKDAPGDAANDDRGQNGKDSQISFRSRSIIHDCRGEDLSSENQ